MMILSPAKTLDLEPYDGNLETTWPQCDAAKTLEVVRAMKRRSEKELTKLLSISANLGKTAGEYWQNFQEDSTDENAESKPCIYAFSGIAYQGVQIHKCTDEAVTYLQNNLRIIDPLYGALRPMDNIQPYRLEMATKGVFSNKKVKLHEFWKESVTASIARDLGEREDKILLNLASDEYSSALDEIGLPEGTRYVKCIFLDNGRVVTVHAKRARGLMTRFVAEQKCQTVDDVKKFDYENYSFDASKSDELRLVFERSTGAKRGAKSTNEKASSKRRKI